MRVGSKSSRSSDLALGKSMRAWGFSDPDRTKRLN